jgi:uncharacterized membrane protein SpoIIM required for sporulation
MSYHLIRLFLGTGIICLAVGGWYWSIYVRRRQRRDDISPLARALGRGTAPILVIAGVLLVIVGLVGAIVP